jgi:hypothetical protein
MSLKEIFLSGLKESKQGAGGSILRQASRRITDKSNRDSAVLSNTDSTVSMSRSALSSASTRTVGNNESTQITVASSVCCLLLAY